MVVSGVLVPVDSGVTNRPAFRLLGSFEMGPGRGPVGAPKPRQLLSLLLLNAGNLVSSDMLVDELWSDHPPASATVTLQTYIGQARRVLRDAGVPVEDDKRVLVTRSHGYLLDIDPGQLDVRRFLDGSRDARTLLRQGDPEGARALLRRSLGLWRGPPLVDVPVGPRLETEIVRLNEERLVATEILMDNELRAGRPHEILSDLFKSVAENQHHERLCGQLMLALYRCGRRAQALEIYRHVSHSLREQLGLDPSPLLVSLHTAMLTGEDLLMDEHHLPW
jgi:DNA-binding SARP family transcriptional activator